MRVAQIPEDKYAVLRGAVHDILESPFGREWTATGLGMLRTYILPERRLRLHVWSDKLITDATAFHTHPWNFTSYVLAGTVHDTGYREECGGGKGYMRQTIHCGKGNGEGPLSGAPYERGLSIIRMSVIEKGQAYQIDKHEIHRSNPVSGTVTLIERKDIDPDGKARMYWAKSEGFVDAMQHEATEREVLDATREALALWEA